MLVLVSLLVGCTVRETPPPAPPAPVAFSRAPLARFCPHRLSPTQLLPEGAYDRTLERLERLDEEQLRKRVCTTAARQEVAIGTTLLAMRADDDELLREIAVTWADPLALAVWSERRSSVHDDAHAHRARLAAALVAHGMEHRSGVAPRAVGDHLPRSMPVRLTDADRRWVREQDALYVELFTRDPGADRVASRDAR